MRLILEDVEFFNKIAAREVRNKSAESALEWVSNMLFRRIESAESFLPQYLGSAIEVNSVVMGAYAEAVFEYAQASVEAGERESEPSVVLTCDWKRLRYSPWSQATNLISSVEGFTRVYKHSSKPHVRIWTDGVNLHGRELELNGNSHGTLQERGSRGVLFDATG